MLHKWAIWFPFGADKRHEILVLQQIGALRNQEREHQADIFSKIGNFDMRKLINFWCVAVI